MVRKKKREKVGVKGGGEISGRYRKLYGYDKRGLCIGCSGLCMFK